MTAVIQGAGWNWRRKKTGREGERENVRKQERGKAACQHGEEISRERWCSMSEERREEDKQSK